MRFSVSSIVERVKDPSSPVVWVDPSMPESLWRQLSGALETEGYQVLVLDEEGPLANLADLSARLARAHGQAISLDRLRDHLSAVQASGPGDWVLVWRNPDILRRESESSFEEFVDLVELMHEEGAAPRAEAPKLIVGD